MKVVTSLLIASVVSVGAFSDRAVNLRNTAGFVKQTDGSPFFVDQVLVQLIWTATSPATHGGVGGSLGAGEILLNSLVTSPTYGGLWPDQIQGVVVYDDIDVGGLINTGYITVRLYDSSVLGWGDFFLQQAQEGSPLTDYDSGNSATVYDTGSSILGGNIDYQGFQIVPEPAVASPW